MPYQLGYTDQLGYNFEMDNLDVVKDNGYGKYIRFANPRNIWAWKTHKGMGVDMVIGLGEDTYYIEERFMSYNYNLSQSWFEQKCLPRFRDYPNDQHHYHIVLANRPKNFGQVLEGVQVVSDDNASLVVGVVNAVTITWLLTTIGNYDYATNYNTIPTIQTPMDRAVDERQYIDHPLHEQWMSEQLERLGQG